MGNYRTCLVTACGVLLLICFSGFESHAQLLPLSEVKALQTIAQKLSGLGKRIFDVSIQGNVVLADFNIMEEAGGAGIGIVKTFDVFVNGSTLEIHLYLIEVFTDLLYLQLLCSGLKQIVTFFTFILTSITLSVADFKVDLGGGLSAGAIAGIVVAAIVAVILVLGFLRYIGF